MPRVKKIIQARDGGPIPVAYSEVEVGGETVLAPVVVLEAGAQVQVSGSNTVEPKSGSGNANLTFTAPIVAVQVFNASGAPLTVTVAGDTHSVPDGVPYEVRRADAPFTAVTIAATGPWYAVGLR